MRDPAMATDRGGPLWDAEGHYGDLVKEGAPKLYTEFFNDRTKKPLYKGLGDDLYRTTIGTVKTSPMPLAPDFFTARLEPQDRMLRDIVRDDSGKWVQTERAATDEEMGTVRRAYALELDKLLMDINVGVTRVAETKFRKAKGRVYDFRGWWTDHEGVISNDAFREHFTPEGYEKVPARLVDAIRQLEATCQRAEPPLRRWPRSGAGWACSLGSPSPRGSCC